GPQVAPDRLDRGGVLALDPRDDAFLETGGNRLHSGAEQKQISHAGDAARRLDLADQDIAVRAERMALEPGIIGPGHAQHRHSDIANGHVWAGHGCGSLLALSCSPDLGRRKSTTEGAANPAPFF